MATPTLKTLTKDTWVEVATAITSARIFKKINTVCWVDFVNHGAAAPTDLTTAVEFRGQVFKFDSADSSDLYVYSADVTGSAVVHA